MREIPDLDDAEIYNMEYYWRIRNNVPPNARLAHRYCNIPRKLGNDNGRTRRRPPRLPRGIKTPQQEFRIPILKVLKEIGGYGRINEILEKVEIEMRDVLNDVDYEILQCGDIRWRKSANFERLVMVQEGLLDSKASRGFWVITKEGIEYINRYNT